MYETDRLEVWNLTPGVTARVGAQAVFNVLGRVKAPGRTEHLWYRLNESPERKVFFNRGPRNAGRLERPGDFNIDTIDPGELKPWNWLRLGILDEAAREEQEYEIGFPCSRLEDGAPRLRLDLEGIAHPQEVGQVVDGKWRVSRDERGRRCLEIRREDAGLDRIIVFGREDWTSSYEVTARLRVTAWTGVLHNVGLLFKWNAHLPGDGTWLPTQWSTGLAYYYSDCPGLRVRFGVDVHEDARGRKVGDYILKEAPLSSWRRWLATGARRVAPSSPWFPQVVAGRDYWFNARIRPDEYTLTVWKDGGRRPSPQVVVEAPTDRLPRGAVGLIAHRCGVRMYEFEVSGVA
ncbi:MAG: hypothetical protein ACREKJ_08585 [Candidatus Rokuibacteriota bacterium]